VSWSAFVVALHACPPDVLDWFRGFASTAVPEVERSAPVHLDDRVIGLSFRKPGEGLLQAVKVLVALSGHQLVFDAGCEGIVVGPDDSEEALAAAWLW
jgi:hypothetical protein